VRQGGRCGGHRYNRVARDTAGGQAYSSGTLAGLWLGRLYIVSLGMKLADATEILKEAMSMPWKMTTSQVTARPCAHNTRLCRWRRARRCRRGGCCRVVPLYCRWEQPLQRVIAPLQRVVAPLQRVVAPLQRVVAPLQPVVAGRSSAAAIDRRCHSGRHRGAGRRSTTTTRRTSRRAAASARRTWMGTARLYEVPTECSGHTRPYYAGRSARLGSAGAHN
jgi:hypothetical protein